jgi:hypothetical protein
LAKQNCFILKEQFIGQASIEALKNAGTTHIVEKFQKLLDDWRAQAK